MAPTFGEDIPATRRIPPRVDGQDHRLCPKFGAQLSDQFRTSNRGGIHRDFVGAGH